MRTCFIGTVCRCFLEDLKVFVTVMLALMVAFVVVAQVAAVWTSVAYDMELEASIARLSDGGR